MKKPLPRKSNGYISSHHPHASFPCLLLSNGNQRYLLRCKLWSSSNFRAYCIYFERNKGFFMNIETQSWICTFFFSICNHHNMPEALKRSTSLSSSVLFIMQNAKSIYNQQQKHRDILKLFTHFSCICTNMHTLTLRHVYTDTHTG